VISRSSHAVEEDGAARRMGIDRGRSAPRGEHLDQPPGAATLETGSVLHVVHLGVVPYREACALQQRLREERLAGRAPDTLLLLEHPPVITLGRSFRREHLLAEEATIARRGIELVTTDRGGSATYHGPGQLVAYGIIDLQARGLDLHSYLRLLEEAMLRTLTDYGITAERDARNAGVWVAGSKIGFVGVHVRRWTTMHGCALNVDLDLDPFALMLPCGLQGVAVTSMSHVLASAAKVEQVTPLFAAHFATLLGAPVESSEAEVFRSHPGGSRVGSGAVRAPEVHAD